MTIFVDAKPVHREGDVAVWRLTDIPVGVGRSYIYGKGNATLAVKNYRSLVACGVQPITNACVGSENNLVAAAAWADLQPKTVPRGRESMTAEQWGRYRECNGTCRICGADDSMWCDSVPHQLFTEILERGRRVQAIESLSAYWGERVDRSAVTAEARELWAQELRNRLQASTERERNRVLVDREFEDWE